MRTYPICLLLCLLPWGAWAGTPAWFEALSIKPTERPPALADQALTAQQLNVRGMDFYKQKAYPQAALLFYEATERDKTHVLAHYNLACTLALLRRELGSCSGLELRHVFEPLKAAIDLDRRRRVKARVDPDLAAPEIQNELAFRLLLQDALGKPGPLAQALAGTSYHIGSYNYTSTLRLAPDGQATWKGTRPDPEAGGDAIPPAVVFSEQGRWRVEKGPGLLRLVGLGESSGLYLVDYGGLKKIDSPKAVPDPAAITHFDFPSPAGEECGH